MCLMLYVATTGDQPCFASDLLHVEDVEPRRSAVRRWLTLPVIRFVGAHTGCSCGFRHIIMASEPIEYHGGMFEDEDEQDDALAAKASLSALLAMLRAFVERDGAIELLPTWDGDEAKPPHGTIDKALSDLQPETWFFIERFLYRVTAGGA
jgi:hypothetical protein